MKKKELGLVQVSVAYQPANRAFLPLAWLLRSLSKGVFERRTSTGSKAFFLLICLDDINFVLLSFFTPIETIWLKIWANAPSKNEKKATSGWRASLKIVVAWERLCMNWVRSSLSMRCLLLGCSFEFRPNISALGARLSYDHASINTRMLGSVKQSMTREKKID